MARAISVNAMQLGRACSTFGAERMQLLCSSLQSAGKNGEFALATEFVDRLKTEFEVVKKALEDHVRSARLQKA